MIKTRVEVNSETSRIRAALVNSGRYSFREAEEKINRSRLHVEVGIDAVHTPAGQSAFLTAVLTGTRCFGEVTFRVPSDGCLVMPLPIPARTLVEAATYFGGRSVEKHSLHRTVLIGEGRSDELAGDWFVQASWNGWIATVAPSSNQIKVGRSDCALAGVAAGALAVGQAFLAEQGDRLAGRRSQVLSLWSPGSSNSSNVGPSIDQVHLPTQLWLIGLGNLGQAYLWSLSQLPYPACNKVLLFLQDDQKIGRENWGTSVLVQRGRYNILKTRIGEEWATGRGFEVRRIDRRMDENLLRSDREPGIAFAGLDGMPARRLLDGRGFEYIIDAGLGATVDDYCKIRVNVFDSARSPAAHFRDVEDRTHQIAEQLKELPAYREFERESKDGGCGAAMLAQTSVAVPFVSAVAGALVITQAIRIACAQADHATITADLRDLTSVRVAAGVKAERVNIPSILSAA